MSLLAAIFALAGFGLALTHDVLLAHTSDSTPRRWDPMGYALQVAGLGAILLAVFVELRRRPVADPPMEHEHALIWAPHTETGCLNHAHEETR